MIVDMYKLPGGRLKEDGPCSAEEFVETLPKEGCIINLDSALGIASSFLDELARRLPSNVLYMSKDKKLIDELNGYRAEHTLKW